MGLLEIKNLTKRFGGLTAVEDLSFTVRGGELLSVIGPNGAGKTTLFNLMTGFYKADSGRIIYDGEDITEHKPHRITRRGIGRTFQMTNVFQPLTALENVVIGRASHGKAGILGSILGTPSSAREKKAAVEKAREALSFVGLEDQQDRVACSLTEEARKRLSIAMTLATEPKLLLLDEPAAGINMEEIGGLTDLIAGIRETGVTVCLIEHKMKMVMSISDRIIVLSYGRKIAEGTPAEIAADEHVIKAYLGGNHVAKC